MNANQFDAKGRQGRNLNSVFFSREIITKASRVAGKGEECVPCGSRYELRKGGRTIGTKAVVLAVYNQLGGRLAYRYGILC